VVPPRLLTPQIAKLIHVHRRDAVKLRVEICGTERIARAPFTRRRNMIAEP
jgi:hypothetical protein